MSKYNSFHPGQLWLDNNGTHINAHGGGLLFHNGRYYWFGEHKIGGDAGNRAHVGVHVYSSDDLYSWKDEGIALKVSDDPNSDIVKECVLERPKVVFNPRTGKFAMWFHLELKGKGYHAARTAVAVSDHVTGPYTFIKSFRPVAGQWPVNVTDDLRSSPDPEKGSERFFHRDFAGGQMARDMTIFVDDDGSAYNVHASEENQTIHVVKLTDDYLDTTTQYARAFPGRSHEAPALFKHEGKYWMFSSDCTGWAPNPGRLSCATHIYGPWAELGNPCIGTEAQISTTFESQSTYVLPVAGKKNAFIFIADRWRPADAIDGRYIWLPVLWENGKPTLRWFDEWDLSVFD